MGGVERLMMQVTMSLRFVACCLGTIPFQEKLEVDDPAGPGDSILSSTLPIGGSRRQANPCGMSHLY